MSWRLPQVALAPGGVGLPSVALATPSVGDTRTPNARPPPTSHPRISAEYLSPLGQSGALESGALESGALARGTLAPHVANSSASSQAPPEQVPKSPRRSLNALRDATLAAGADGAVVQRDAGPQKAGARTTSQIISELNRRYAEGGPSQSEFEKLGVIVHAFDNSEEWTTSKPWRPCVNYCPTSTPITFFRQVSHHPLFPHMARPTFPTYDRHIVFTPQRLHDLKEPAGHLQSGSGQGRHHLQHEGVFLSLAHFPICHTPFFLYN